MILVHGRAYNVEGILNNYTVLVKINNMLQINIAQINISQINIWQINILQLNISNTNIPQNNILLIMFYK